MAIASSGISNVDVLVALALEHDRLELAETRRRRPPIGGGRRGRPGSAGAAAGVARAARRRRRLAPAGRDEEDDEQTDADHGGVASSVAPYRPTAVALQHLTGRSSLPRRTDRTVPARGPSA